MKILYFTRDYTPHDYRFLAALAETEHEVYYLRLEKRGHAREDRPVPFPVKIVKWAGGTAPISLRRDGWRLLRSLKRVLREIKPDVVHAGPVQDVALLAALAGAKPLVSMSWGYDMMIDAEKDGLYRWATDFVLKRSAVFVGDNQAVKQKAINFGFPAERIVTFPWGVDVSRFVPGNGSSELRTRKGWEDNFVVLHTRTWAPVYGVDVFARAFVRAVKEMPNLRLFMLGNGPLAKNVRQIFMSGGVDAHVHYGGQVNYEGLPAYYQASDLYVSASHTDGSSVSLMEALASGVPALVSDIPGNQEWIRDDFGAKFEDGNVYELADQLVAAVKNVENLKARRIAARKLAEEKADWTKNFSQLLEAYEMAVNYV